MYICCVIFNITDIDECMDESAGCSHECVDIRNGTSNSYQCKCRIGFSLSQDQHNCTGEYLSIRTTIRTDYSVLI